MKLSNQQLYKKTTSSLGRTSDLFACLFEWNISQINKFIIKQNRHWFGHPLHSHWLLEQNPLSQSFSFWEEKNCFSFNWIIKCTFKVRQSKIGRTCISRNWQGKVVEWHRQRTPNWEATSSKFKFFGSVHGINKIGESFNQAFLSVI